MAVFDRLLRENRFTPELVVPFEQKLFFEGARQRPYLERFGVLLVLSVIIATMGILGDSTATVIGAMIVAPLMTPIMATAAALVTGNMGRAVRSLLLVGVGVGTVVGLSWLLGTLYTGVVLFDTNSQITGRVSPKLIDLIAALASGAAGAFCLSRDDVADSLPGVAIAISLVPPLCVVGVSLAHGEWGAAEGALLLFVTNFLAILLAGGGVLASIGLTRAATVTVHGRARRYAFIAIVAATALVAVPLVATGTALNNGLREEQRVRQATVRWLAGTDFTLRTVAVSGDEVDIAISGPGTPPSFATLASAVADAVGHPVVVELEVVPSQKQRSDGAPAVQAR